MPTIGLRPLTTADVLDGGFAVIKARPRRILGLTAVLVVPAYLIAAYLQRDAAASLDGNLDWWLSSDPTVLDENMTGSATLTVVNLAAAALPAIVLVFVAAALAHLIAGWSTGRDPSGREMAAVAGRRWWALLASWVLVHIAEGVGLFLCLVPALFIMPLFVPVAPIIGTEGVGPLEALSRSVRLVRARYWPTMGTALLIGLVASVLGLALSALPQGLAILVGAEFGWLLVALGSMIAAVILTPFVAAATVLLYFDLRVRTEGLDIELRAIDTLDRAS